jgi:hypothetical protein
MPKYHRTQFTLLAAVAALGASISWAQSDPRDHREDHRAYTPNQRVHPVPHNPVQHNAFYPARGAVVHALPTGFVTVHRPGADFFFAGGVWYRQSGPSFVVIAPPLGVSIGFLPVGYTTVWVGAVPYYYANDVYYTQGPDGYVVANPPNPADVVTTPPPGAYPAGGPPPEAPPPDEPLPDAAPPSDASTPPAGAEDFFIYPKNGQSDDQQARDRYECHSWAMNQTGFDSSQPSGGVPPSQAGQKLSDYRRAMSACLEARGYTVK